MSDSDDDEGPENEDAWLYEDLTILLKLWMRKREKEGLLALIFEVSLSPFSFGLLDFFGWQVMGVLMTGEFFYRE